MLKEVVTTAANHNCGAKADRDGRYRRSGTVALPAVLGRLAEQLGLQCEDVVEHAIDSPALEPMVRDHPSALEVLSQGCPKWAVDSRLATDLSLLEQLQATIQRKLP